MTPKVTALVDTFNHEGFIHQAILSVINQDFPCSEIEILFVDDGSTDGTAAIVEQFGPTVRLLKKVNGGQASAFNAGIREAKGEIIAFLDGDDWWAPDKLTKTIGYLDKNPEVGVLGHGLWEINSDSGKRIEVVPIQSRLVRFVS